MERIGFIETEIVSGRRPRRQPVVSLASVKELSAVKGKEMMFFDCHFKCPCCDKPLYLRVEFENKRK
jgi:hypothetical protein